MGVKGSKARFRVFGVSDLGISRLQGSGLSGFPAVGFEGFGVFLRR